jgi:NitT/TauT family transport system substrate-binding protein
VLIAHEDVKKLRGPEGQDDPDRALGAARLLAVAEAKYGFTDEQTRPYTFNIQPFVADKNAAQQGYLTSEPFAIQKAGVKATVLPVQPTTASSPTPPPCRAWRRR